MFTLTNWLSFRGCSPARMPSGSKPPRRPSNPLSEAEISQARILQARIESERKAGTAEQEIYDRRIASYSKTAEEYRQAGDLRAERSALSDIDRNVDHRRHSLAAHLTRLGELELQLINLLNGRPDPFAPPPERRGGYLD